MPPKNCGKCGKQVYPVDELKCLDKVWHKGCFKCQECGMTLNMKNYKGFDKLPYCVAHYPEVKHTQVAETPESKRIAENTKLQSQIKYHEEFEKAKGLKISVADDPETVRARKNMQTISQIVYHGELEKKQLMEESRPVNDDGPTPPVGVFCPPPQAFSYPTAAGGPGASQSWQAVQPPTTATSVVSPVYQQPGPLWSPSVSAAALPTAAAAGPQRSASSQGSAISSAAAPQRVQPAAPQPTVPPTQQRPTPTNRTAVPAASPVQQKSSFAYPAQQKSSFAYPAQRPTSVAPPAQQPAIHTQASSKLGPKGRMVKAMYDYRAADTDEVTFKEGDVVVLCDPIDDGWLIGTVEKTGQRGMLPANYVSKLNW